MKRKNKLWVMLCTLLLFLATCCFLSAGWYLKVYGNLRFESILYTLFSAMNGVEKGLVFSFIAGALVPSLCVTVFVILILFPPIKSGGGIVLRRKNSLRFTIYPFSKKVSVICCLTISVALVVSAAIRVDLTNYITYSLATESVLFEENFVDPTSVNIVFPEKKQNLIYIYLESMETSFLGEEEGGGIDTNAIPELYALAQENINFSHNENVGGFSALSGAGWTIGAMVSITSGIPLKTPFNINGNSYGQDEFLPGVTTLSDILHKNGYYQSLMVGSEGAFGGRKQYYEQHNTDTIYDLSTAKQERIVPEDYYVWWGMEDYYLFEYAKQELLEISKKDQPFAFSMLTVDTHHIGGYVCEHCDNIYTEQYENVLACSSKQVYAFVEWAKQQDFYENTTIIISGDHPTMDGEYVTNNIPEGYERKVYNCFINGRAYTENTQNREFCSLDMFPTTLAALGCTIEGERLGLGTNLFSNTQTLCEELGTKQFDKELSKKSDYYNKNFYR